MHAFWTNSPPSTAPESPTPSSLPTSKPVSATSNPFHRPKLAHFQPPLQETSQVSIFRPPNRIQILGTLLRMTKREWKKKPKMSLFLRPLLHLLPLRKVPCLPFSNRRKRTVPNSTLL